MGHEFSGPEPRKSKRAKARFDVSCLIHDPSLKSSENPEVKKIDATMLDLSKEGMAIRSRLDIPLTSTPLINFTLIYPYTPFSNTIREISTEGRVVNRNIMEEKEYRLGIYFTKIKEEDRAAIADFVRSAKNR